MNYPIPIPTLGWNARDPFSNMDPRYAIQLKNILPDETTATSRKGYEELSTGLGGSVETLATYKGESGSDELLAFADSKIYAIDTSTGTATEKRDNVTHNNRFRTLNINNLLVMVNGESVPATYDGTNVANLTITAVGLTAADLNGVMSFKSRAYYWIENENAFWYCGPGAHTGAVTKFPLNYVASGGGVTEIVTWTRDSGSGMDDLFVILMNTGEALVYQGSDPSSASTWSIIGKFTLAQPISIRGSCNLGSDRVIITKDGYTNLSTALTQARLTTKNNVGDNIVNDVRKQIELTSDNFGWDIQFLPSQSLLLVNVPISDNVTHQHVMNTNTGAWSKLQNMNGISWIEHANQPYFGTADGKVMKAFSGYSDNGRPIKTKIIPAFNALGDPSRKKTPTICTVITDHLYPNYISVDTHQDFNIKISPTLPLPPENAGALWGAGLWGTFGWGQNNQQILEGVKPYKYHVVSNGFYITVKIRQQSKTQQTKYYSINLKFKGGKA